MNLGALRGHIFELSYWASVGTVRGLSHSFSAEATLRF